MERTRQIRELVVAIKGAGDLASGVAWRLHRARIRRIYMLELTQPLAVRRRVAYSEAIYEGKQTVEGVTAVRFNAPEELKHIWAKEQIAVGVDPAWTTLDREPPDVLIDAILAKKNMGTRMTGAPLVIGLGPGFEAGQDVHRAIETQRGHDFGRVMDSGVPAVDTGIPGNIAGYSVERVLRAPADGIFQARYQIGDKISNGATVAKVKGKNIEARLSGVLRGLIRNGVEVRSGMKVGDIDPRGRAAYCETISDKARSLGGAVLEAILEKYNY